MYQGTTYDTNQLGLSYYSVCDVRRSSTSISGKNNVCNVFITHHTMKIHAPHFSTSFVFMPRYIEFLHLLFISSIS